MKKISFLTIAISLLLFLSCGESEIDSLQTFDAQSLCTSSPRKRDVSEAFAIASNAIQMLDSPYFIAKSADCVSRKAIKDNVICIQEKNATRSESFNDTLLYVFNFEDENGFAIISANPNSEGLIAIADSGNYSEFAERQVASFGLFMDMARSYAKEPLIPIEIDSLGDEPFPDPGFDPLLELVTIMDTVDGPQYGPLISVRWHQSLPFNKYCYTSAGYRAPAGCVPVAIAQTLSSLEYPSTIRLSYTNDYPYLNIALDWDSINMTITHSTSPFECTRSGTVHYQIGNLLRQIGYLCDTDYSLNGSSTTIYKLTTPFQNLDVGFSSSYNYTSCVDNVRAGIRNGHPAILAGTPSNSNIGHAWNLDGYKSIDIYVSEYRREQGSDDLIFISREFNRTLYYNHLNWGWKGLFNGYFLDEVFRLNSYDSLDPGCTMVVSDSEFNTIDKVIYDIHAQ